MTSRPPTTDPQDEPFDVLDDQGRPSGLTKPRRLVHRDGDWHGALHIWLGAVALGVPAVLYQRRSLAKDTWPGALDVAIGGHIRSGESLAETIREAEEEIGLALDLADLTRIGRRFAAGSGDGVIDREVQEVFAIRSDLPLGDYRLHPDEVASLVAIDIADALRLFSGEAESIPAWEHPRDAAEGHPVTLRRLDFAGRDRRYPLAALTALRSVITGETPEPFELRAIEG